MTPIKGLSDQRRLPRLGKIHLGEKVVNARGVEYPRATDYFVVPEEVAKIYGPTPTELDIMFPIEDEAIFASQFYRAYSQSRGLICKGDGERAARLIDVATKRAIPETGEVTGDLPDAKAQEVEWIDDIPCPGRGCPYYLNNQCRELMMLQFVLPRVPGLGVWQLDTSSYYGMLNINSSLAMIRQMFGRVAGVPLLLCLEPIEVSPDGKKKTVRILQVRSKQTLADVLKLPMPPMEPLALPPAEDEVPALLYPTPEAIKAREEAQGQAKPSIENVGQFLNWATGTLHYTSSSAICADMGVEKPVQILKLYETWDKAVAYMMSKHAKPQEIS